MSSKAPTKEQEDVVREILHELGRDDLPLRSVLRPKGESTIFFRQIVDAHGCFRVLSIRDERLTGSLPRRLFSIVSLVELELQFNNITGSIPEEICTLVNLEVLNLWKNNLSGPIPSSLGTMLKLRTIGLGSNQLTGSIPESIGELRSLENLYLDNNKLSGHIPEAIGRLPRLQYCHLQNNRELCGSAPVMLCQNVRYDGTAVFAVRVKTKRLKNFMDYGMIFFSILLGYADLFTDGLAIYTLFLANNFLVACLNCAFILLNLCMEYFHTESDNEKLLVLLQLQHAWQGILTLMTGRQTQSLVRCRRFDAICRCLPSMILQIYALLRAVGNGDMTWRQFEEMHGWDGNVIIVASVVLSALSAASTLAALAPKSGESITSLLFVYHAMYYLPEVVMRTLVVAVLFVAIGAVGCVVVLIEILTRAIFCYFDNSDENWNSVHSIGNLAALTIIWMGSDSINGPDLCYINVREGGRRNTDIQPVRRLKQKWVGKDKWGAIGGAITTVLSVLLLAYIDLMHSPVLDELRSRGVTLTINIVLAYAWYMKLYFYFFVSSLPKDPDDDDTVDERGYRAPEHSNNDVENAVEYEHGNSGIEDEHRYRAETKSNDDDDDEKPEPPGILSFLATCALSGFLVFAYLGPHPTGKSYNPKEYNMCRYLLTASIIGLYLLRYGCCCYLCEKDDVDDETARLDAIDYVMKMHARIQERKAEEEAEAEAERLAANGDSGIVPQDIEQPLLQNQYGGEAKRPAIRFSDDPLE